MKNFHLGTRLLSSDPRCTELSRHRYVLNREKNEVWIKRRELKVVGQICYGFYIVWYDQGDVDGVVCGCAYFRTR